MKTTAYDKIARLENEIDNLSQEILNQYQELNLLYHASERLGLITDIREIAEIALDDILEQVPARRASMMLFDQKDNSLSVIASRGVSPEFRDNDSLAPQGDIIKEVITKGNSLLINDLHNGSYFSAQLKQDNDEIRSMLSVPLMVVPLGLQREPLGAINLVDRIGGRGYFTSNDQKLASAVASQASVAIKKVLLLDDLKRSRNETKQAFLYTVHSLARAAEANDDDTGNHIIRVGNFSRMLACELGYSDIFCEKLYHFAQVHDVGKIHIHPDILRKPGKLTPDEFECIKTHCLAGADIIGTSPYLSMAREIARSHHEKWDGSGYPAGLKGEEIPLPGRIVTLADIYDALRSKRKYKPAFTHEKTVEIITQGDGRTLPAHFDPKILDTFKRIQARFEAVYNELND